jgi:hypothetical protein
MKRIVIAFDCDWTLISNFDPTEIIPNHDIVFLLKLLHKFKNVDIVVWSGRGAKFAEKVCSHLMIKRFVKSYHSKNHQWIDQLSWKHIFFPDIYPDICIDDIHDCQLWLLNLIVKEK